MFYVSPASGRINYTDLRKYVLIRFMFITQLHHMVENKRYSYENAFEKLITESPFMEHSNAFIVGSKRDRTAHDILRFISTRNRAICSLVLSSETCLAATRLRMLSLNELQTAFAKFTRDVRKIDSSIMSYRTLRRVAVLLRKYDTDKVCRIFQTELENEMIVPLAVPWTCVPNLVSARAVVLRDGSAILTEKSHFEELILFCFSKIEKIESKVCKLIPVDSRLRQHFVGIYNEISNLFYKNQSIPSCGPLPEVNLGNIDNLSHYFPPCMKHLHMQLRARHRLNHHARIQHTLFLKEIGLSLQDNERFWQQEYEKCPTKGEDATKCTHSWHQNAKRYLYGINHLYGLQGGRTSYSAHRCSSLQKQIGHHGDNSGCVFRTFSWSNLKEFILQHYSQRFNIVLSHEFLENLKIKHQNSLFSSACTMILEAVFLDKHQGLDQVSKTQLENSKEINKEKPVSVDFIFHSQCQTTEDVEQLFDDDSNLELVSKPSYFFSLAVNSRAD